MSDLIERYLACWNETDEDARRRLVEDTWTPDAEYVDPLSEAHGHDAINDTIGAVQAQFPGLVMRRTSPIDGHRDLVRFTWALGAPGEAPVFAGLDVAKTDDDGKLHRIIGFAGETVPAA